jgi:hypothetical protein
MGVSYKPHTVTLTPQSENQPAGVVTDLAQGTPKQIKCLVVVLDAAKVIAEYGVELNEPAQIFCEASDGPSFKVGYLIDWSGAKYKVYSPAVICDLTSASHARVMIEKLQYTEVIEDDAE